MTCFVIGEASTGETYHVFNRSIASYRIFNDHQEYSRMINSIRYYQIEDSHLSLSDFLRKAPTAKLGFAKCFTELFSDSDKNVQIIAHCLMPTHFHLVLKQLRDYGISTFISNALNSYTRYFNRLHMRKGPLWEGPSKKVLVETDEQLLHLTRYVHINPSTAHLVEKPEDWPYSSYNEYLLIVDSIDRICSFNDLLDIKPSDYKKFVEDQVGFQRNLALIKKIAID